MPRTHEITVEVSRIVTFNVTVKLDTEYDDDGCGSPSKTGNSMTGCRGKYVVAGDIDIEDTKALASAALGTVEADDDEIADALSGLSASDIDDEPEYDPDHDD